jgi:hypothetical protein
MLSAPRPYLIRHQERRTGCTYERGVRAGARRCQNPSAPKGDGSKEKAEAPFSRTIASVSAIAMVEVELVMM